MAKKTGKQKAADRAAAKARSDSKKQAASDDKAATKLRKEQAKKTKAAAAKRRRASKKAEAEAADKPDDKPAPAPTSTEDAKPAKGLVLLRAHNDERLSHWRDPDSRKPVPNGIACPRCGNELLDKQPGVMQPTVPPRVNVLCGDGECEWRGVRVG